jgi:uncharacterized membrane protein YeaQ/YmgE (transglycosylase-associated protein family)
VVKRDESVTLRHPFVTPGFGNTRQGYDRRAVESVCRGTKEVPVGEILLYVLVGLVVGLVARLLLPGRDPIGIVATIVLGVVGALIGGWLFGAVFEETEGVDWIGAIVVSMLLLFLYRKFAGGTRARATTTDRF